MPAIPQYEQRTAPNGQMLAPNARGIRLDDSEGQGLAQVGAAGVRLADSMKSLKDRQEADDAQAWIAKTMADTRLQWTQHALESRETAAPGGAGYTPDLLKQYDDYAGKTLEGAPNAHAKAQLTEHLVNFRTSLGTDALGWEAGQRRAWRADTITQGINTAATVVQSDPRQYDGALNEQYSAIDGLQMQPEDKIRLKEKARQDLSVAAVQGQIQTDPHAVLRDLQGATPVDASTPQGAIISAAKAAGEDPKLALAVSSVESRFNPTAKNPRSSAYGLYQFLPSTGAQYGLPAEGADVPSQAKAGVAFIRDTRASLEKSLGRKPEDWEIYMGHVFGGAGAPAILKAPDAEPVEAALAKVSPEHAQEMASANGLAGMTVGQVKDKWKALTAQALDRVSGLSSAADQPAGTPTSPNTAVDSLTVQERVHMRSAAETEVNRQQAIARQGLDENVRDATAAYTDGRDYPNPPGLDQFVAAYGPAEGSHRYGDFRQTQQLGADIGQVKNLSFSEQNDLLARRVPQEGEGYAGADKRFQTLAEAVGRSQKAFAEDPAKYAITSSPKVNAAYAALTGAMAQPTSTQGGNDALKYLTQQYVTAQSAEQSRIAGGTPGFTPKLVPDAYADYIVQQFGQQGQGGQNAANYTMQLADQWGSAWPQLYGQLSKKLPPAALVIGAGMDQAPASMLAEASKMKREELLDGLPSGAGSDVKKALVDSFADFGASVANQVGGSQTFNTFYGETEKLALMYTRAGDPPAKAAQKAYAATIGSKYSFQGTYRVPVQQEVAHVTRGADLSMEALDGAGLKLPVSTSGLTPDQTRVAYVDAIKKSGYWVTSPDESGLVLYANGAAVLDAANRPVQHTWEDLAKRSKATPGFFRRLFGGGAPAQSDVNATGTSAP